MAKKKQTTNPKASSDEVVKIHELLTEHRGRSIRRNFIGDILGITDDRVIRDGLSRVVLLGLGAVVPDRLHGGYKLSTDVDEIRIEVAHLDAYKGRIHERIKALRKIASSLSKHKVRDVPEAA